MKNHIIFHELGRDALFKTWHASTEYMIMHTCSDGGSLVCSEKIYPLKKGTLCFVGIGKYHYTMPENPEEYNRSKLFISPEYFDRIMKVFAPENSFSSFSAGGLVYSRVTGDDETMVEAIFSELNKFKNDPFFDEIAASLFIRLLVMISKNTIDHSIPVSGSVNLAIDYINKNIFKNLTIDEICSSIHVSKYHFCRNFRLHTGMTVMNYILKTRIVIAKNLLLSEKTSISEVSNRCGFSSVSYFCRVFKAETGMSPANYRKISNKHNIN